MFFKVINGAVEIDGKTILEQVNIDINKNDHIALVGRNGVGKSTLLKALIDPNQFSEGIGEEKFLVSFSKSSMGFLKQNTGYKGNDTLLQYILQAYDSIIAVENKIKKLEEKMKDNKATVKDITYYEELLLYYKNIGGYDYKKEYLTALIKNGFYESDLQRKFSSFSGGEQTKIDFIKLLLSKPDLLLLDEPTNHLDIEAILWLEDYLKNYPAAFILVSHDRLFINKVVNKIYEIEYGETHLYLGNYEYFEAEKKRRYFSQLKSYERQQKEINRLQSIVERFRYKPSKASMAMSKLHQIEKMKIIDKPDRENKTTFNYTFKNFKESGKIVLKINDLRFGYKDVLGKVNLIIEKGRKIAIVGKNGTGKTTFLKTIMNIIPSLGGKIEFGYNVKTAYFDQQFENLNSNFTVYEEFKRNFTNMNDYEIRSSLANFLFFEEDICKKLNILSGGEKVRLELAKAIYSQANFLILDEPTNHLDIYSKEKLEEILQNYPGTILFVSHDRYFIKKIADSIIDFSEVITCYNYNYEDYLVKKIENKNNVFMDNKCSLTGNKKKNNKQIEILNKKISKLEQEIEQLKQKLFLEEIYTDSFKYQEIEDEIRKLEEKLNKYLLEWS